MNLSSNVILNIDSYKTSMWKQLPPNTSGVYSYVESRGGRYDEVVFFGLQAFIKEYLINPITQNDIDVADRIITQHGEPFNKEGWEYILKEHNGYLPIVINAVPEGSVVPIKNVLSTIENTDPKCAWLTTCIETALLRAIWYGSTVATQSWHIRQMILSYLEETGDPTIIDFKLHDFGARGVSTLESAAVGGTAHLVNFLGTDNISALLFAEEYYSEQMAGFSIPASEHSISCAYGENEREYVLTMLNNFAKPGKLLAMVADTYNVFNFCRMLGEDAEIREKIENHAKTGGLVIIRPDSGDPTSVCSDIVRILDEQFGSYINDKGYKVLNCVRIIQGDGVNEDSIKSILERFKELGYSTDNIAFGVGGALLQQLDRDTQKFALKCSAIRIDDVWKNVNKSPITDSGKASKAGRWTLYQNEAGEYHSAIDDLAAIPALMTVFRNGQLLTEYTFKQIRKNSGMYRSSK